jgi:signal transduction histidine kinase
MELTETPLFSSIIIKDSGEGIDKKDLPHIFERFYKGTDSVKTESVGIGLALSKLIIEGQEGTISVWSEKGRGTRFEITFLKSVI